MNKNTRNTIIFSLALLGAIILTIALFYITSFRTVTFELAPDDLDGISVYDNSEREVGSLEDNGSLRLQPGEYTYTPVGERYSHEAVEFTVEDNETIIVNPNYSNDYKQEILRAENPAIVSVITNTFGDTMQDFTIDTGTIYLQGDWYATTLTQHPLPGGQQGDIYRVVLHKEDDEWQIVAGPEIVLSAQDYPDVPFAILTDINSR